MSETQSSAADEVGLGFPADNGAHPSLGERTPATSTGGGASASRGRPSQASSAFDDGGHPSLGNTSRSPSFSSAEHGPDAAAAGATEPSTSPPHSGRPALSYGPWPLPTSDPHYRGARPLEVDRHRSQQSSPNRPPIYERVVDYFDFQPPKESLLRSPDHMRHELSTSMAAEGAKRWTSVATASPPLHGPINATAAAAPASRGPAAVKSPYLQPTMGRRKRTPVEQSLPGRTLPLRPLSELIDHEGVIVVGAPAQAVRGARRRAASGPQAVVLTSAQGSRVGKPSSAREGAAAEGSDGEGEAGRKMSLFASLYGYVPPLTDDGSSVRGPESVRDASSMVGESHAGAAEEPLHAAAPGAGSGDEHNGSSSDPEGESRAEGAGPSLQHRSDSPTPSGTHASTQHLSAQASAAGSATSSRPGDILTAASLRAAERRQSLSERSAAWRSSLGAGGGGDWGRPGAARAGGGGPGAHGRATNDLSRSVPSFNSRPGREGAGFGCTPPSGHLGGTLEDWVRHSVHTVGPEASASGEARPPARGIAGGRQASRDFGGVPPTAWSGWASPANDPGTGGLDGTHGSWGRGGMDGTGGPSTSGGGSGGTPGSRGRRRRPEVQVDPEIVRMYTQKPPKLCTPNNASRPVTSSDFLAFRNHTVNRAGTPNMLRTPLGVSMTAGSMPGQLGTAPAAEARGITPLSALMGPSWLSPADRPRSPHLGIGGILGSATSVPGLHVPLELEPRPRSRSPSPPAQPGRAPSGLADAADAEGGSTWRPSTRAGPEGSGHGHGRGQGAGSSSQGSAARGAPMAVPAVVRCGAGELKLDVSGWLTPASGPTGEVMGLFGGDDGTESMALLSRVFKGTVQCDLGWAEITESLLFMSNVAVPNAVLRFPIPPRAILQRFAATIGGTTLLAESVPRSSYGATDEDDDEDDDFGLGPGAKVYAKLFGRRNHQPGTRPPVLRVPLGRVRGDVFVNISYIVQLESSGNTLSLTHVCHWTPARNWAWAAARDSPSGDGSGNGYGLGGGGGSRRFNRHRAIDLYDLSFEMEVLSHRGLNLVSGPKHMTIKPNYDCLLCQGHTQVWKPRHVTHVTFEVALPAPLRSFAILHDARQEAHDDSGPFPGRPAPAAEPSAAPQPAASSGEAAAAGRSRGLMFTAPTTIPNQASEKFLGNDLGSGAGGAGSYGMRRGHTGGGVGFDVRSSSHRHCAAVTFVPGSHFSPAELEDALGSEVAPGPRAQAAAWRLGLPSPGASPTELLIILDCCGPSGMAAHLMYLLQTLLVLLRSLPVGDGGSGGGGGTSGSASAGAGATGLGAGAAAAVASAGLFNLIVCPGGPPPPDPEDDATDGASAYSLSTPPGLAALHAAKADQASSGGGGLLLEPEETIPPVWLFPGGSRPLTSEAVDAAVAWVGQLLTDPATLVLWAQPLPRLHTLLHDLAATPRAPGCRRAALVLTQQLQPREHGGADVSGTITPLAHSMGPSRALSRQVSRGPGAAGSVGGLSRLPSRRSLSRALSRLPTLRVSSAGTGLQGSGDRASGPPAPSGAPSSSGGADRPAPWSLASAVANRSFANRSMAASHASAAADAAVAEVDAEAAAEAKVEAAAEAEAEAGQAEAGSGKARPSSDGGVREDTGSDSATPTRTTAEGMQQPRVNFGETPRRLAAVAAEVGQAAAAAAEAELQSPREGSSGQATPRSARRTRSESGVESRDTDRSNDTDDDLPPPVRSASPTRPRPRSSIARSGQPRLDAADGVRWSGAPTVSFKNLVRERSVTDNTGLSDSDAEARMRARAAMASFRSVDGLSPPRRGGGGWGSGAEEEAVALAPPPLDFPVFVVVHQLPLPPSTSLTAVAGGNLNMGSAGILGTSGPSYMLAYHLYQKHLEGLMYEQARADMEQHPLSYFEKLADAKGGFLQVVPAALDLPSALNLAACCAVSGRYLRRLQLVPQGASLREQYPARLPPALPLSEPLSVLVRLSRMGTGAALVLQGLWPDGRPASMSVSVDPRLRTGGQLLALLCAMSELSALFEELPPPPPPTVSGSVRASAASTAGGIAGLGAGISLKQKAVHKKVTQRAQAFNLATPLTAMSLVSMTLARARGLAVKTATSTLRSGEQRKGFSWPAPGVAFLAAQARGTRAHAAHAGTTTPHHASTSFGAVAAAAQVNAQISQLQLDLPPELSAAVAAIGGTPIAQPSGRAFGVRSPSPHGEPRPSLPASLAPTQRGEPTTQRGEPTTQRGEPTTQRGEPTHAGGAPSPSAAAPAAPTAAAAAAAALPALEVSGSSASTEPSGPTASGGGGGPGALPLLSPAGAGASLPSPGIELREIDGDVPTALPVGEDVGVAGEGAESAASSAEQPSAPNAAAAPIAAAEAVASEPDAEAAAPQQSEGQPQAEAPQADTAAQSLSQFVPAPEPQPPAGQLEQPAGSQPAAPAPEASQQPDPTAAPSQLPQPAETQPGAAAEAPQAVEPPAQPEQTDRPRAPRASREQVEVQPDPQTPHLTPSGPQVPQPSPEDQPYQSARPPRASRTARRRSLILLEQIGAYGGLAAMRAAALGMAPPPSDDPAATHRRASSSNVLFGAHGQPSRRGSSVDPDTMLAAVRGAMRSPSPTIEGGEPHPPEATNSLASTTTTARSGTAPGSARDAEPPPPAVQLPVAAQAPPQLPAVLEVSEPASPDTAAKAAAAAASAAAAAAAASAGGTGAAGEGTASRAALEPAAEGEAGATSGPAEPEAGASATSGASAEADPPAPPEAGRASDQAEATASAQGSAVEKGGSAAASEASGPTTSPAPEAPPAASSGSSITSASGPSAASAASSTSAAHAAAPSPDPTFEGPEPAPGPGPATTATSTPLPAAQPSLLSQPSAPLPTLDGARLSLMGPPMTAAAANMAHQLTVLGQLAVLQQADGSWPHTAELEELVVTNGRTLNVPVLGAPKVFSPVERATADAAELRAREALAALHEAQLRGAVRGALWSTVLALALLRARYGGERASWIALEAKAFAFLDARWPPASACPVSPPNAIMAASRLL